MTKLLACSTLKQRHLLANWNNTTQVYPKEKLLHELFEEQAEKSPDNIAVIYGKHKLTYRQLNNKANQLAHYLKRRGIKSGNAIAILMQRSINMIVSILGILKAGGAYLPIAHDLPQKQLEHIFHDNCLFAIIDNSIKAKTIEFITPIVKTFNLNALQKTINKEKDFNLKSPLKNEHSLAYIIYTSGTTSYPKGIEILHNSVVNHMYWMIRKFSFNQKDVILQKTPFTFDASIWELFIPILSGGKLVFASRSAHKSPLEIINQIKKFNITTLQVVPSVLRELLKLKSFKSCPSLRHVFSGGEILSPKTKQNFFNMLSIPLHNLYGPSETTIQVTSHTCINSDEDISHNIIGKPIDNTKIYILDQDLSIVPIGVMGEIHVAGDCLAQGYLNNSKLTAEKFIYHDVDQNGKTRLYKTGDLARYLPDGNIEIIGRSDDQVKIRGFRVELSSVENNILSNPNVKHCAVILKKDKMGFQLLVAYVELERNAKIKSEKLRAYLKNQLPEYMIPSIFIFIDKLPTTPHSKIDKRKLSTMYDDHIQTSDHYKSASTKEEHSLLKIWEETLDAIKIGVNDDFFSIGGHSLSVLEILTKIEEQFCVEISIDNFIKNPTISKLAKHITKLRTKSHNKIATNKSSSHIIMLKKGEASPLFLIHPVGGTVFWYILLAKYLKTKHPIYAIQDPGITSENTIFQSIEQMAEFYLQSIKKIQPQGPYLIGGASFGATVAIEIANQLLLAGEQTSFIPILDGWAFYPDTLLDKDIFKETMERQYNSLLSTFKKSNIIKNSKKLLALQKQRLEMIWDYKIDTINHHLTLFKSKELLPVFEPIDSPCNHWDKYSQNVEIHLVPGNHETMFQKPHALILANTVDSCISKLIKK